MLREAQSRGDSHPPTCPLLMSTSQLRHQHQPRHRPRHPLKVRSNRTEMQRSSSRSVIRIFAESLRCRAVIVAAPCQGVFSAFPAVSAAGAHVVGDSSEVCWLACHRRHRARDLTRLHLCSLLVSPPQLRHPRPLRRLLQVRNNRGTVPQGAEAQCDTRLGPGVGSAVTPLAIPPCFLCASQKRFP